MQKKKNVAKEPFVVGANKLLGGKLGWIYLQHYTCFPEKFRDPFDFHRFPRGTRMGCAINRLSDTSNFYFKDAEASTIKEEGIAETIQFCGSFYVELRFRKAVKTCLFLENRCFALNVYTTD